MQNKNTELVSDQQSFELELVKSLSKEEVAALDAAERKAAFQRNISVRNSIENMIDEKLADEPRLQSVVRKIKHIVFEHAAGRASGAPVKKEEICFFAIDGLLKTAAANDTPIMKLAKSGESVYLFVGTHWKKLDKETVRAMLPLAAYKAGVPFSASYVPSFIDDLNKQLLDFAYVPTIPVNTNEVKINLQNGTLIVNNGKISLKPHDKKDRLKYCINYDYAPGADCPTWLKHLDRVLPDKDTQAVLQEFIAWCLIPHEVLNMEAILFMTGDGSNGKSTVQKVFIALLGKENVCSKSLSDLSKSTNSRLELQDKLANIAGETKTKFDSDFFKALASGEAIEAKKLYQDTFTMTGGAKHIFAVNERPREVELTHGFFRKYLEIPFNEKLEGSEKIKNYENILYAELPGILNWALEGVVRLMEKREFTQCSIIEKANQDFRANADSVLSFIKESEYVASEVNFMTTSTLYNQYEIFVGRGSYPVSERRFSQSLEKMGFKKHRKTDGRGFYLEVALAKIETKQEPLPF
jgi:putative DNA primase/helicase